MAAPLLGDRLTALVATYRPQGNPFYQFWLGLRFFWAGLGLLRRSPRLQVLSLAPTLVTLGGFVGVTGYGWRLTQQVVDQVAAALPAWVAALGQVVSLFLLLLIFVILIYVLFLPLLSLVASPFREGLAGYTEQLVQAALPTLDLGQSPDHKWWQQLLVFGRETLGLLGFQLLLLVLAVVLSVAAPVIGTVPSVAIAIFVTGLDMVDPALGRKGYGLGEKITFVGRHRALVAGFGGMTVLFLAIPVLNLLILPVATIGATLMVLAVLPSEPVLAKTHASPPPPNGS